MDEVLRSPQGEIHLFIKSTILTPNQPTFMMVNDGGPSGGTALETVAVVIQRTFLFWALSQALPVVLLRGAEFRDSKVT
jgi:hypothetical protein